MKFESENETLNREKSERIGTYLFAKKLDIVFADVFAILAFKSTVRKVGRDEFLKNGICEEGEE